jgi:transposase
MRHFVGLDWGGTGHAVCVVDEGGRDVLRFAVAHTAEGLAELRRRLARLGAPADLPVAIERPSGLVVDALLDAGHPVVPVHPNAAKAARPRYRMSGAKSDGADARLLADLLRTDGHRLRPLRPQPDGLRALRALVRGRDDLVAARVQLANQLRAVLDGYWPGAAAVFADIDSPIALAFIRRYPTPASARGLGERRLAGFLAAHAYCGRRAPAELLAKLRGAPAGHAGEAEEDARGEVAAALAATLERLVAQIALLTARVGHAVAELPEGRVVMSFPRAGRVCAAQIAAELGGVRERFPNPDALAMEAGVAPVTKQSGKSRSVVFRWACNKRLRAAVTCFADNSRHASEWAAGLYRRARARGCDHPHAVRVLARAWLRVLWKAWQDDRTYDPRTHTAAVNAGQPQPG